MAAHRPDMAEVPGSSPGVSTLIPAPCPLFHLLISTAMNMILFALALLLLPRLFAGLRNPGTQAPHVTPPEPESGLPEEEWHLYGV